jgi:hypothetical protein
MSAAAITNNASIGGTATIGTAAITGNATIGGTAGITGNTTLGGWIGTASYASQVSGWRITNAGAADVRYLFTDELRAKLFTADSESVLAGSMRITKSYSTVAQPFTCPAAGATSPLWVYDASTYGDAPVFQANDFALIHLLTRTAFGPFTIADCVGTVSAYADGSGANAGQQSWTFTRGTGTNSGAMTGGTVVPVNQLVQDMGTTGNGYVEISAVDGPNSSNAPYIQTNIWTTAPVAANTQTMCRLGNLNGVFGAGQEYGLGCFGTGSGSANQMIRASNFGFELRNLPITVYQGGNTVFYIEPGAPYLALGNPLPQSYAGTNKGFWMGNDAGTYKLRIGNPTGNRLTWDGNVLQIAGEGSGITNINGANIQAGTITAGQLTIIGKPGGAALNTDPNFTDHTTWLDSTGVTTIATITDGIVGTTALRSPPGAQSATVQAVIPVDRTKTYRAHIWARSVNGANGQFYFRVAPCDASGGGIALISVAEGVVPSGTWTEYHVTFGAAQFPAATRSVQMQIYLNWSSSAGYMEVQDARIEEAVPTTLITPGAITTDRIAAGAVTTATIAAGAVTAGNIDASGFGDNLIKNGAFEGPHGLDGWEADPISAAGIQQSCCGTRGPGTLYLNPPAGGYTTALSRAMPVIHGQTYRIAADVYPAYGNAPCGLIIAVTESNTTGVPRFVGSSAMSPPDVVQDSQTVLVNYTVPLAGAVYTHYELLYTVNAVTNWVSLAIVNYGQMCGSGQPFHVDAVEMQAQIGAGHIRANSITANNIAAGTITGDRIAARTIISGNIATGTISANEIGAGVITGDRIAANTITGGNIAGRTITAGLLVTNTITSNEIGVRAIVAGNIATGTLTANEIASATITGDRIAAGTINANNIQSGSITADRLSVTALSAISANLGNITAGTISSVTLTSTTINSPTINAGCTTINANGIALNPGQSNNCNWYKWTNGAGLYHDGGAWMGVSGASFRVDTPGGAGFLIDSNFNLNANSNINLNGYVTIASGRNLTVSNLSGSGNRLVCTNNNGTLYVSAANGSC